jgi:hypothetical protein
VSRLSAEAEQAPKVSRTSHRMMGKGRVPEGDHQGLKAVKRYRLPVKQIMDKGGDEKVLLVLQIRISVGTAVLVTGTKVRVIWNIALEAVY